VVVGRRLKEPIERNSTEGTMSTDSAQIVARAWNFAHVLRDVGLSYMAYTEQITFLLFLKMAHELTRPPHNRKPIVPAPYDWPNLLKREGDDLEVHYRHTLEELGKKPGMLGQVFLKARPDIQNPALVYRLIRNLIEPETWTSLEADVKGDIYEGLLAKSAEESPKGAGQYFTPRPLIQRIVDEFVKCYHPANRHARKPTWDAETNPEGRWRAFDYAELARRDKSNLDVLWLRDKSLEESEDLPEPDVLAQEIADELQAAYEQFAAVAGKLRG
jgi:hypothetical protein